MLAESVVHSENKNPLSGSAKPGYITSFDGLRAFAVCLVLINHGSYGFFPGGFLGVDLFFIISGYLITSLLWAEYTKYANISLLNFYARRILRLYPALLISIVLALALWPFTTLAETANKTTASFAAIFYLANVVDENVLGNMHHLWSLSVEEHFYLIWPLFILLVAAKFADKRVTILVVLIAAVSVFRIVAGFHEGDWRYGIWTIDAYSFTLCRIDCILIGALMFFLMQNAKITIVNATTRVDEIILGASLAFVMGCCFLLRWTDTWWLRGGFLVTNAVSALIILGVLKNGFRFLFQNRIMIWMGKRSYGIYVYHVPIYMVMEDFRVAHNHSNLLFISILRIVLTLCVAELSYRFVEKPVLRYKKRFHVSYQHSPGKVYRPLS
jgi:peptidoglycan/LPS O-acetylase OafA/YrhL